MNIKDRYLLLFIPIFFSDLLGYIGLNLVSIVSFLIFLSILIFTSKKRDFIVLTIIGFILSALFIIGYLLEYQTLEYFIFPLIILSGFLLAQTDFDIYQYRSIIIIFLIVNLIALVLEKYNGYYLLDNHNQFIYYYGQGLFGWTKLLGEFIIAIGLLFNKDKPILILLLLSALLSGSRAATLMTFVLLVSSYFIFKQNNIKYKINYFYIFIPLIMSIYFLIPRLDVLITDDTIYRFTALLNSDSSSYNVRDYIHNLHYGCIENYSIDELLLGKGKYCTNLFNWGAESTVIHVIEYYGSIVFSLMAALAIYIYYKNIYNNQLRYFLIFTVICIYMLNWRFGFTYSGIFIWYFIFKHYKKELTQ